MKRILLLLVILVLSLSNVFAVLCVTQAFAEEQSNISVTAIVGPNASDYQFGLTAPTAESIIPQNTTINYVITYGASSSAGLATPLTIVADWSNSDAANNVPILDYVPGSGRNAYGNTSPVVDLANRTITWNISSIPEGTMNQQVSFDLRTNTNYTGPYDINFTVKANMSNQYMAKEEQLVSKTYRFSTNPNPNVTSTPAPQTTTQTPSSPPTQTKTTNIINVSFIEITSSTATLLVDTNNPAKVKIMYGTSSRSLTESITSSSYALRTKIKLDNLKPATNYYFRVVITDESGNQKTSEIFTFQTAEKSTPPDLQDNIIILTNGGNILLSDIQGQQDANLIALLTPDSDYELNYSLRRPLALKSIDAIIRNKVLGITNQVYASEPQTMIIPMTEKSPSTYFASLRTLSLGLFEVSIRVTDIHGNIKEQKVAELKVMPYLSVFDEETNQPITDSRVFFFYYNTKTQKYEPLSRQIFSNVHNPSYSTVNGIVKINLPPGKYQALVGAFGYAQKRVDFVLGPNPGEDFPHILLHKDQTNIAAYLQYYGYALSDLFTNVNTAVSDIAFTVRFFNLIATIVILITIFVTFVFFTLRTRLHPKHIYPFVSHHLRSLARKHPLGTFCAIITDDQGRRIQGALISVLDDVTGELITSIASNTIGICYLFNPKEHKNLKLLIIKQGYMPKTIAVDSDIADTPNGLTIILKKGHKPTNPALANSWLLIEVIAGRFFEVSLFVSLILELFFLSIYGLTQTLPFFALSLFNLILWIFYQHEKHSRMVFKKT